jgi:hypothetical protein
MYTKQSKIKIKNKIVLNVLIKIFQQPNPWLMGIMSVLAEMHSSPDFKLNLKFEIEVLCRQLQIQLTVNKKKEKDFFVN